jgi:Ca2+-transporting ATPase
MDRPPRDPDEGLFSRGLWRTIAGRGAYIGISTLLVFLWSLSRTDLRTASTMAYATLVTVQLISAFDCRSETRPVSLSGVFSNLYLVVACLVSWLMLLATIQFRPVASLFRTVPLSASQWLLVFLVSAFPDLFRAASSRREQ